MLYRQDISGCLAERIGAGGLDGDGLARALGQADAAVETVRAWYGAGSLPLLALPERRDDLADCDRAADFLRSGATDIVVCGTGGSSLGAQALAQLAWFRVPGALRAADRPAIHFLDNLDAGALSRAFSGLDLSRTRFLLISKSGGTPETVVQTIAALEALRQAGLDPARHVVALTEPGDPARNPLRRLAERHRIMTLEHDPKVGGRYSVLSSVGALPAMLFGLDPVALRQGAEIVLRQLLDGAKAKDVAPALGAAVNVGLAAQRPVNAVVLMAYSDRLRLFTAWFQQLWAESLGKAGRGSQPVGAVGPVDQHSQLQLFLAGPDDKLLNLVLPESLGEGPLIPESYRSEPDLAYLAGRRAGDLVHCQGLAIGEAFVRAGRPVRRLTLGRLDEPSLGALLMHFMLETILVGLMWGIDPFDQPAVEQGKVLTREYLAAL